MPIWQVLVKNKKIWDKAEQYTQIPASRGPQNLSKSRTNIVFVQNVPEAGVSMLQSEHLMPST